MGMGMDMGMVMGMGMWELGMVIGYMLLTELEEMFNTSSA